MEYILYAIALFLFFIGTTIILSIIRGIIPPMPSTPPVVNEIIKTIKENDITNKPIYEIGSGYGYMLFRLANNFPNRKIIGFEISLFAYITSSFLCFISRRKNIKIIYGNAFKKIKDDNIQMECCVAYLCSAKGINIEMENIYKNHITNMLILNTYPLETTSPTSISAPLDIFKSKIFLYKK